MARGVGPLTTPCLNFEGQSTAGHRVGDTGPMGFLHSCSWSVGKSHV